MRIGFSFDYYCVVLEEHRTGLVVDEQEEVEEDGDEGYDDEDDDCEATIKSFHKPHLMYSTNTLLCKKHFDFSWHIKYIKVKLSKLSKKISQIKTQTFETFC